MTTALSTARRMLAHTGRHPVVSLFLDLGPSQFATAPARATQMRSLLDEAERDGHGVGEWPSHVDRTALSGDLERVQEYLSSDDLPVSGARALAVERARVAGKEAALAELENRLGAGGAAARGLAATLEALAERRVETLVLALNFTARGTRCPRCGLLYPESTQTCPADGETVVAVGDLRQAAVEAAVMQDAGVTLIGEGSRPFGKSSEPAVDLGAGCNRLARRRPPTGRDRRPAPLGAGGESTARSRIACPERYGVSRLLQLQRCGDERQDLGYPAEVKHMLDSPRARTDHQVHVLRPRPAGELEDETDADDVDEAQSTEIEHDTLGIAGQRPADGVPEACARGKVTLAIKLDAGSRPSLRDDHP